MLLSVLGCEIIHDLVKQGYASTPPRATKSSNTLLIF